MSDEPKARPKVSVDRPNEGDLQLAIHALSGVFTALDWIDNCTLYELVSEAELRGTRHSLIVAGRVITEDFRRRF
jgi:hypothetical protein